MIYEPVELPSMHPIEFRNKWGLTNTQVAFYLNVSEKTIAAYAAKEKTDFHRNPSRHLQNVAGFINQKWEQENRQPLNQYAIK